MIARNSGYGYGFSDTVNKYKRKLKEYAQKTVELPDDLPTGDATEESFAGAGGTGSSGAKQSGGSSASMSLADSGNHEIGEMMQMNHSAVRSWISRGLNKMKEFLA